MQASKVRLDNLFSERSMSKKMAMRQMTWFSMVSSNWDDSFGSQHLPSDIYALAEYGVG